MMEQQYLNLLQNIMDNGVRQANRTGIDTLTLPGATLTFDLRRGFPALTTKELKFGVVVGELIGFLRGCTSAAEFRELGCNVWNKNANEHGQDLQGNFVENKWLSNPARQGEDDLGAIYGAQWRGFRGIGQRGDTILIDQIAVALDTLRHNPESRRILVSAWNPAELDQAALPPCHVLFQLLPNVEQKVLHMTMYQRSADMFLGVPFNIASYALLLELFAAWSGYTAGTLTMFLADAHIYVNHIDQVKEQLVRAPFAPPRIEIDHLVNVAMSRLDQILGHLTPDDIRLANYNHHPAIKAPMAV